MKGILQVLSMFAAAIIAAGAVAQTYPSKPIRVLIGYPAGHNMDISMRVLGPEMSKRLGQPIIVENRPGAESALATNAVKEAAPDGYTLLCCTFPNLHPIFVKTNATIGGKDVSTIGDFSGSPLFFLVRSSLGPKTFAELVAYSKANPGKLNYASLAVSFDLLFEGIKARTGIIGTTVRYKGSVYNEMLRGEVDINVSNLPIEHVQSGRIIALFGSARIPAAPQVPLATEVGLPPVLAEARYGLWGPPGLPDDIRRRLSSEIAVAARTSVVSELFQKLNLIQVPNTPEDQQRAYDERVAVYAEGARLANHQPQ